MITLKGYQITDLIYESVNSQIYRAIREEDKQRIILKVLRSDYPTTAELTRYKQEYEITRQVDTEGVIKAYSLEKFCVSEFGEGTEFRIELPVKS